MVRNRPPGWAVRYPPTAPILLACLALLVACQGTPAPAATPAPSAAPASPVADPPSVPAAASPGSPVPPQLPGAADVPGGLLVVEPSPQPRGAPAPLATVDIPPIQPPPTPAPTWFSLPPLQRSTPAGNLAPGSLDSAPPTRPPDSSNGAGGAGLPALPGLRSAPIPTLTPAPPVRQPTLAPPSRPTDGASRGGP